METYIDVSVGARPFVTRWKQLVTAHSSDTCMNFHETEG